LHRLVHWNLDTFSHLQEVRMDSVQKSWRSKCSIQESER
jgi:hypothetical protein